MRFTVTPDVPFTFRFDVEERLAMIGPALTLKGMFFLPHTKTLGPEWRAMTPGLVAPPRFGSYLPFSDYPMVDYLRLCLVAAKKKHPRVPLAEAVRLLERGNLHAFTDSTVGKVMTKMLGDCETALLKISEIQRRVVTNGSARAALMGPRWVRIEFHDLQGWLDCAVIGNLEGVVFMYGHVPIIEVELLTPRDGIYDVRW